MRNLICCFFLGLLFLGTGSLSSANSQRQIVCISDDWRFTLGDNSLYSDSTYNDQSWRKIDLPHDWSIEGKYSKSELSGPQGGFMPCGKGWYRKQFKVAADQQGKRFFIRFDGVYMKSQVWINQTMVGEYPNGYNSFEYDITPFIKYGTKNTLAVKVDNSLQPSSRWYTGSGIYRNVWLISTDQMHFTQDGVFVKTVQSSDKRALLDIDYKVINHRYKETVFSWTDNASFYVWLMSNNKQKKANNRIQKECTLRSVLYNAKGEAVARQESKHWIGDFTDNQFKHQLEVLQPQLWSPESPQLYRLESSIAYGGNVVDQLSTTVGIRTITFSPQEGMLLNGKKRKVQGVCLHQNMGCFGAAVPMEYWRLRLKNLKEMGCNAVRVSHYPFAPEFYNYCDTLGILVSNEIFDEWNRGQEWDYSESSYGKMAYSYHLYFNQWAETDLRRMIQRDRNHPSVFMYMLGNEIPNQRIKGLEIAKKLQKICKEEDPTRPTTAACDFFVGANMYGFMDQFDIAGYNYIDRIHADSLYSAEASRYPHRVLLGTETYHKTRNHNSVKNTPSCIGEFVWVGYDYLGEIYWPDFRGWNEGIFDIAGFPKSEFYLRKSYWSSEPVVHIGIEHNPKTFDWSPRSLLSSWNWTTPSDSLLNIYVYTNCEEIDLLLNGKSLGRKKVNPNDYYVRWANAFTAGKLKAVAYRGSKKVAEYTLNTPGNASRLLAQVVHSESDFKRVELIVADKKGRCVDNQDMIIEVESSKNIELLGMDNGNQYDPKGIKYSVKNRVSTYQGKAVLYVRKLNTSQVSEIQLVGRGCFSLNVQL